MISKGKSMKYKVATRNENYSFQTKEICFFLNMLSREETLVLIN
jgi:hypothetical protein